MVFQLSTFIQYRWGYEWLNVFTATFTRIDALCIIPLVLITGLGRDVIWKVIKREFFPEARHIVQELEYLKKHNIEVLFHRSCNNLKNLTIEPLNKEYNIGSYILNQRACQDLKNLTI